MASKETENKSLREFLREKASKVSLEALQSTRFAWMTNRDVSNGKPKCDPAKIAPTVVKMAIESTFLTENTRQITGIELDKIIEASGDASGFTQKPELGNGKWGIIRGGDGSFSNFRKIANAITIWGNAGTICRK